MKKNRTAGMIVIMLLSTIMMSCGCLNTEFSQRKYLDGYKGKPSQINKIINQSEPMNKEADEVVSVDQPIETGLLLENNSIAKMNVPAPIEEIPCSKYIKPSFSNICSSNNIKVTDNKIQPGTERKQPQIISIPHLKPDIFNLKDGSHLKEDGVVGLLIKIILAFILPPLAVFLHVGLEDKFWISLILTLLFWVPGVIHALLVVLDVI